MGKCIWGGVSFDFLCWNFMGKKIGGRMGWCNLAVIKVLAVIVHKLLKNEKVQKFITFDDLKSYENKALNASSFKKHSGSQSPPKQ